MKRITDWLNSWRGEDAFLIGLTVGVFVTCIFMSVLIAILR